MDSELHYQLVRSLRFGVSSTSLHNGDIHGSIFYLYQKLLKIYPSAFMVTVAHADTRDNVIPSVENLHCAVDNSARQICIG